MSTKIFVNLPVKDLKRSMDFFAALGFTFNPQFTDETAACMKIADDIYTMLLTHAKFGGFTNKQIADTNTTTEMAICLALESKEKVNEIVDNALNAGAGARETMDYGFMFSRSFDDPDGHAWEVIWMDPAFINKEQPEPAEAETSVS